MVEHRVRYRANISRTSKSIMSFDATVEVEDADGDVAHEEELRRLELFAKELQEIYPPPRDGA